MSHTIDYSNIPDGPEKVEKAMQDIRFYLGSAFFKMHEVVKIEMRKGLSIESLRFQCAVSIGIEGYPVDAWFETIKDEIEKEGK